MENSQARRFFFLFGIGPALLLFLCSCESIHYGSGTGHFDTVILDAGHGAHDTGARARFGFPEKVLTLDTSRRLASILRAHGFHVIETRTDDYFVPLGRRVAVSNASKNSIFVSIHYNWTRKSSARGMEIFFESQRSARLAANILREATRAYRADNRGIKRRGFYVLRNNNRPAVLCELGFVSNPTDNRSIQNPAIRQSLAECIAAGIIAEKNNRQP